MTTNKKTTWVLKRRGERKKTGNWAMLHEGGRDRDREKQMRWERNVKHKREQTSWAAQRQTEVNQGMETPATMTTEASTSQAPCTITAPLRGLWTSTDSGEDYKTHEKKILSILRMKGFSFLFEQTMDSFQLFGLFFYVQIRFFISVEMRGWIQDWTQNKANSWKPHFDPSMEHLWWA